MIGFNTTKQCPWKACTKTYGEHTIDEINSHKKLAYASPQAWQKTQNFATIASIFSSFLLVFWILLGGLFK